MRCEQQSDGGRERRRNARNARCAAPRGSDPRMDNLILVRTPIAATCGTMICTMRIDHARGYPRRVRAAVCVVVGSHGVMHGVAVDFL